MKKRLRQYPKYNNPVAALAFNNDGARLAVGASYTWDEGEDGARKAERPSVFIRKLGDEVKVSVAVSRCSITLTFCHSQKDGRVTSSLLSGICFVMPVINLMMCRYPGFVLKARAIAVITLWHRQYADCGHTYEHKFSVEYKSHRIYKSESRKGQSTM